jgi:hypothetical protein
MIMPDAYPGMISEGDSKQRTRLVAGVGARIAAGAALDANSFFSSSSEFVPGGPTEPNEQTTA